MFLFKHFSSFKDLSQNLEKNSFNFISINIFRNISKKLTRRDIITKYVIN